MRKSRGTGGPGWTRVVVAGVAVAAIAMLGELVPRVVLESPLGGFHYRKMSLVATGLSVMAVVVILWSLSHRLALALLATGAGVALMAASHIRTMQLLDRPLMPWDLLQGRQVLALFPTVLSDAVSMAVLVALIGCCVGIVVLVFRSPGRRLSWPWRLTGLLLSTVWLATLAFQNSLPQVKPQLQRHGIVNYIWDQKENLQHNGLLLATLMNVDTLFVSLPGYDEAGVRAVMEAPAAVVTDVAGEEADVVVYMAEAVFDPTKLGVPLSTDPMPTLRRLMRDHTSGTAWSPHYGGGTANVEFEVLTGLTTAFLPEGAFPYQHYVNQPLEALPAVFHAYGYRTLAIHNFHGWYWMRQHVYPLLGFDAFIPLEQLEPWRGDRYPSDEILVNRILSELADETTPSFIFAISMVTHGAYAHPVPEDAEVEVETGLSKASARELTNYASALIKADRALARLVEALEKRQRRTVLVVFGDHLPALGRGYGVYKEAGYVRSEPGVADFDRLAQVPLLIWSNRPEPKRQLELGMPFLGPEILAAAGIRPRAWFARVNALGTQVRAVTHKFVRSTDGRVFPRDAFEQAGPEAASAVEALRLLTHDRLLGRRFSQAPGATFASSPSHEQGEVAY